jgi:plasmid stabilization system protein ParE
MRLEFHPEVATDIAEITRYYTQAGGEQLADQFWSELLATFLEAAESPQAHALLEHGLRRANLPRFPYHFLFRTTNEAVRVLVVRHHRRAPSLGAERR